MKTSYPFLVTLALLSLGLSASGSVYYLSSASGNDSYSATQAQNQATPWKTIAKLNSFFGSLNPGDSVMLQAGSVFTGPLLPTKSGTVGHLITISIYGSGAAPVITGFTTLTGWVSVGGNIWQAPCAGGLRVNMVEIASRPQPMGRYPNTGTANGGYAQVQSFSGTTSITDSHLASGPNWTGADLVLRKTNWIIERDPILSQSGGTITYQNSSSYSPTVKFGYFIQNSLKTLDQNGEWYYDPVAKKMNLYSTTTPSGSIQASIVDTLAIFNNVQNIKINGIIFTGANKTGMSFLNSSTITLTNCTISFSGLDGIDGTNSNVLNIDYCNFDYNNNDAVYLLGSQNYVQDCKVQRTATFPGMGNPVDAYTAVWINGGYNTVLHNTIDTTGYIAVKFQGNNNTIQNNLVDYFCYVADDGGGIYTWSGNLDSNALKNTGSITSNIVLHGMTAMAGTDSITQGIAHGIYLDENTMECAVTGNTVSHCSAGVFFQDSRNCTIQNNTLYDNAGQIVMRHNTVTGTLKNNDVSNNFAVSNVDTENVIVISSILSTSTIPSFAYMHNNHYAQVLSSAPFCHVSFSNINTTGNFANWQVTYGMDVVGSALLPVNFLPYTINSLVGSDLWTRGNITTQFLNALLGTRVVVGTPVGPLDSATWYAASATLNTPDNTHTMLIFLEQVIVPYLQETQVISVPMIAPSTNSTVAFKTTGSTPSGGLVFQTQYSDPRISVTNITLYRANVSVNDPDQNVIFQYNPTKSAVSLALSGVYQDASGTVYQGTVSIPAYGSLLLFKKT